MNDAPDYGLDVSQRIRKFIDDFALIDGTEVDGRVKAIVITKLQEAELWAKELTKKGVTPV